MCLWSHGVWFPRLLLGEDTFPKPALEYLNDWAVPDKGWLCKFYRAGTDEAQFDLTPASEKTLAWLEQLSERQFVGIESRLLALFDLLKQMRDLNAVPVTNPASRIMKCADVCSMLLRGKRLVPSSYVKSGEQPAPESAPGWKRCLRSARMLSISILFIIR